MIDKIRSSIVYSDPFDHIIIDNFFDIELANKLSEQFPVDAGYLYSYNNKIEVKQVCNHWDRFPKETYNVFWNFCSKDFTDALSQKFNNISLCPDITLHGAGWHIHKSGGKLNIHQDYVTHPKINYKRKLNLLVYLSKEWDSSWNGGLQLWSHDDKNNRPKNLIKTINIKFNRAVIFDTTQNSWHGLPDTICCPANLSRKSLAMYYLIPTNEASRNRALFVPTKEQEEDPEVLSFISERLK